MGELIPLVYAGGVSSSKPHGSAQAARFIPTSLHGKAHESDPGHLAAKQDFLVELEDRFARSRDRPGQGPKPLAAALDAISHGQIKIEAIIPRGEQGGATRPAH